MLSTAQNSSISAALSLATMSGYRSATDSALHLALDRDSVREKDGDGRMRVKVTNLSKATVNPYRGKEIPGWAELGLDPDKIYQMFRDPDELKKAADSANGVQLLAKHVPVSAEDHQPWDVVGATGTDAKFEHPYLTNSLHVWSQAAIDAIESDAKKELSMGYHYKPDMTPGNFDGKPYDGVMRDIRINHVALVKDGRAGPDVMVGDSKENLMSKPTRFAAHALLLTSGYLAPLLAKDAKIDLMPIFKDLTRADFKAKPVAMALDSALKGQLAKDADISHVAEMLDHLERAKADEGLDEAASEPEKKAMEAASTAGDADKDDDDKDDKKEDKAYDAEPLKAFLKEKGVNDADIAAAMDLMPKAMDAEETEEEKKKREAAEASAKDAAEQLKAKDAEMKDMVKKPAMDAAIASATKQVRETERGIRIALAQVRPYVGELPETMAFDSGDDVKRHALGMLGVPNAKKLHADALDTVLSVQRKAGARPVEGGQTQMGMDEASVSAAVKIAPGLARIKTAA